MQRSMGIGLALLALCIGAGCEDEGTSSEAEAGEEAAGVLDAAPASDPGASAWTDSGRIQSADAGSAAAMDAGAPEPTQDGAQRDDAGALADDAANDGGPAVAEDAAQVNDAAQGDAWPTAIACAVPDPAPGGLLDLGHGNRANARARATWVSAQRVLSADATGHWVLWNSLSGERVAQGDAPCTDEFSKSGCPGPIDMRGDLIAIDNGRDALLELRDADDGALLGTVSGFNRDNGGLGVAEDGSYAWYGTDGILTVVDRDGSAIVSRDGYDRASTKVYAAPSGLRIAEGNLVETLSVPSGALSVSSAFLGTAVAWFGDGERFLTTAGSTVRVYSRSASQQKIVSLPSVSGLGGYGDHFWTVEASAEGRPFRLYAVGGGDAPVFTLAGAVTGLAETADGTPASLVGLRGPAGLLRIVDVSQTPPAVRSVQLATNDIAEHPFAASAGGDWAILDRNGVVFHQRAGSAEVRSLGCGAVADLDLSQSGTWAVATAGNQVLLGSVAPRSIARAIQFRALKLRLSADGRVLAALADRRAAGYAPERGVTVFDVASGRVVRELAPSVKDGELLDFELSQDGARLATSLCDLDSCTYQVTSLDGVTSFVDGLASAPGAFVLAPDGRRVAIAGDSPASSDNTKIFEEGELVGATSGVPLAWLDQNQLLRQTPSDFRVSVVSWQGDEHGPVTLPASQITGLDVLRGGTQLYVGTTLYALSSGATLWSAPDGWRPLPGSELPGRSAANDSHALCHRGARVLLEPLP